MTDLLWMYGTPTMEPPVATWWIALTSRSRPTQRVEEGEEDGAWEDVDESVEEAAVVVDDGGEEWKEENEEVETEGSDGFWILIDWSREWSFGDRKLIGRTHGRRKG